MESQKTILCVDDDDIARFLLTKFVENIGGYGIAEATSGQECLDYISRHKVDLIILDYNLGDINGIDVCSELSEKSVNPEVKVIISSVLDSDEIIPESGCKNISKIVQKPYTLDELDHDVKQILEN